MATPGTNEGQTRVSGARRAAASRLAGALLVAVTVAAAAGAVPTGVPPRAQPALVYEEGGWIYRARLDGTQPVRLVRGEWPELSPDGRWISFERERGYASYDIHVLPVAGGESTVVSRGVRESDWTFDSNRLVVTGDEGTMLVDRRGGSGKLVLPWRTPTGRLSDVSISAARDRLVFVRSTGSHDSALSNIFSAPLEGGESIRLTSDGDSSSPLTGPDLIAFTKWTTPGDLWFVKLDGSGARQITDAGNLKPALWLPDGRTLVAADSTVTTAGPYYRRLFAVDVATGSIRPLTPVIEGLEVLGSSHDGRTILVRTGCMYHGDTSRHSPGGLSTVSVSGGTADSLRHGPCSGSWSR
ncbi:MAG: TolB family protein [Gaiellaceae bacterium]